MRVHAARACVSETDNLSSQSIQFYPDADLFRATAMVSLLPVISLTFVLSHLFLDFNLYSRRGHALLSIYAEFISVLVRI